jgi:hypothetical protein
MLSPLGGSGSATGVVGDQGGGDRDAPAAAERTAGDECLCPLVEMRGVGLGAEGWMMFSRVLSDEEC